MLYRVNSFEIHLAPLRERREDIIPLAQYLLKNLCQNPPQINKEALEALKNYSWRGNVRQLRNTLERAILLTDCETITIDELPPEVVRSNNRSPENHSVPNFQPAVSSSVAFSMPYDGEDNRGQLSSPTALHEVERQQIIRALEQTNWHRGKTAELLGISPSTLYRRLREYNLDI